MLKGVAKVLNRAAKALSKAIKVLSKAINNILNKVYKKSFNKAYLKVIGQIIAGTFIVAICTNIFLVPYKIIEGGVTGTAIILHYISGQRLPVGLTAFIMTIPLFIVGFYTLGKHTGFDTIIATVLLSLFIDITFSISKTIVYRYFLTPDEILNYPTITLIYCLISGVISGIGFGIIYRTGASTGGTDLAAMIINKYMPKISIGTIIMILDGAVIILSGVVFKSVEITIYAVIRAFISTRVIDFILKHSKNSIINSTNKHWEGKHECSTKM